MRILMLADGRAVHTVRFQAEMKRQGCEVVLASLEPGDTVDYYFKRRTGISGIDYTLAGTELNGLVRKYHPDIINPHYASGYGYIVALGNTEGVPVVVHCLGSDILIDPRKSFIQKWRIKFVLGRINKVLVDSDYLGEKAQKYSSKTDYKVVYWGADDTAFEIYKTRQDKKWPDKRPLKVLVPRSHKKVYNNLFILDGLQSVLNEKKIEITFPNWGEAAEEFRQVVSERGFDGQITLYGYKSRNEYNRMLGEYDVYLSASKSDSSPASLIEAMAAGLFPVAGNIPGVREWLDISNGRLFDLNDPVTLKNIFTEISNDAFDPVEILKSNHERALLKGRFRENIAETIAYFEKIIGNE